MNSRILILAITVLALTPTLLAQTAAVNSSPVASLSSPVPNGDPVQPATTAPTRKDPVSFRRDGLWLSTHDGHTFVQVHGYAQLQNRMFSSNTHAQALDTVFFRKVRPLFEGTLFNNVDFRFMPDFGQSNPQIQEAFLELKTLPYAKVRVGKFKEPVGLEALRQDRDLTFPERSLASDLIPLRYIGAQLSGSLLSKSLEYQAGYFDGSSDGSNGVFSQWAHGNEGAARIFALPFARTSVSALQQFGLGLAGSTGVQHGTIPGLKTIGQTTFFKYSSSALADGQHNRLAPQAYYYAGPFGLIGEYALSSQEVLNKGISGRIHNQAWQVAGSVVLTGEKNGYSGVKLRNAFEPGRGFDHFGALELAFRYSQVQIDGDAFPQFANPATSAQFAGAIGIGFNWYLTHYVKLQTDYEHTRFRMAPSSKTPLHSEDVLISQLQLSF